MSAALASHLRRDAWAAAADARSPLQVPVGVIGTGKVGRALLGQIGRYLSRHRTGSQVLPWVCGIANSRAMCLGGDVLSSKAWERGDLDGENIDLDSFAERLRWGTSHMPVIVDLTASQEVAARHQSWLRSGLHVVTANKLALACDYTGYRALRAATPSGGRYAYETTVGAALPVIQTLRDLQRTGDRILRIQGALSGTLSFLFSRYDGSRPFSELVWDAHRRGLTEPDPRADLSGMDVARKLLILAREAGLALELQDITVEDLVPEQLRCGGFDGADPAWCGLDDALSQRLTEAQQAGGVLRYAAVLESEGRVRAGLEVYPRTHPFAGLAQAENLLEISTARYQPVPLVIRGPGAGAEVTAAGVLADILKVADPA